MTSGAVVVTGASTGIGESTAVFLVKQGFHVFGGVRRAADGERLRNQLGEGFTSLVMDVTDAAAITAGAARLKILKNSARNWTLLCSSMAMSLVRPKSKVATPGPMAVLRPTLP